MALLTVPLLRDFHFESAMLAGIIGCFWAAFHVSNPSSNNDFLSTLKILGTLYIAAIPLFIFSAVSGCLTFDGFGFWIFIPFPSTYFGAAIGRLVRHFKLPFPKLIVSLILLCIAAGILVIEFFSYPQVYFYNHVWGLWPGPIYDESVKISASFLYFRWLTFLWILLLWMLPDWSQTLQTKLITVLTLICLMFSYMNLDEAGIISPATTMQERLGGVQQTKHFNLYFDEQFYSQDEIDYWAARHEFHFQEINEILQVKWPKGRKIDSYLYAHAWQKKKITGAKFTSYVPIWLPKDQLHIAKQQLAGVLKHEMVHVISKRFGNDLFNGSWSIGLIEGLAEGIAKDASSQTTLHQIVAAEKPWPSADQMKSALSVSGFYGSAGAISYTTAGSFVEYLLDEFPVNHFKKVYADADFETAYQKSFESLISGWHQTLAKTTLDSVDQQVSEFIFARRSLFGKQCPHAITEALRLWDRYQFFLADQDTSRAHQQLHDLYDLTPNNALVKHAWSRIQLQNGNYETVAKSITSQDTLLELQVLKADALFLAKDFVGADSVLNSISAKIQSSPAPNFRFTIPLRKDSLQWDYHTRRRYQRFYPDSIQFHKQNLSNKMLALNKSILDGKFTYTKRYAVFLSDHTFDQEWFDIYTGTLDKLAFLGDYDLALSWLSSINKLELRERYAERAAQKEKWIHFLANNKAVAD
jgi:hypothetical protein